MNARLSSALSVIIHIAMMAMLSMIALRSQKAAPPQPGMEIEITGLEHAMPLPEPAVARSEKSEHEQVPQPSNTAVADGAMLAQAEQPAQSSQQAPKSIDSPPVPPLQPVTEIPAPPKVELAPRPVQPTTPVLVAAEMEQSLPAEAVIPTPPRPAAQTAKTARPGLDPTAISRSLAAKVGDAPRSTLNSAAIGSAIGEAAPKGAGALSIRQRANLADMIRSQITPCWNPPIADGVSGHVTILMRIRLDRAGRVQGQPAVSRVSGRTSANDAYANALAGSVRRAILRCAPLQLPDELYDAWANVELNFDPKDVS